jgi:hypothetical protein
MKQKASSGLMTMMTRKRKRGKRKKNPLHASVQSANDLLVKLQLANVLFAARVTTIDANHGEK